MKVKFMTMSQCKRIIEAGFVGEHRRDGSQVDYCDYQDEILAHYWEMKDSSLSEYIIQQYEAVVKGVFNMKSICLMVILLSYGCASNSRIIKSERHDTYLVGLKCPVNYYYRLDDRLCHFSYPGSVKKIKKVPTRVQMPKRIESKPVIKPIDAFKVSKQGMMVLVLKSLKRLITA